MNTENFHCEICAGQPINLMLTMDADIWAKEFMDHWLHRKEGIDLDLMRSWFASAIMCGWDHAHYRQQKTGDIPLYRARDQED